MRQGIDRWIDGQMDAYKQEVGRGRERKGEEETKEEGRRGREVF